MASIVSNGQPIVAYAYDSAGRPAKKTFGNGMSAALSYDAAGRLARVSFSGGPVGGPLDLTYQWDPASQLTSRTWNGHTQIYEYDPSGQLLKVSEPVSREVAIDAKGGDPAANSKSQNPNSKLLESYTYDKAGNMLEKSINGEKTTMTYDAANQLATSTSPGRDGSLSRPTSNTFTYDKAGRLLTSPAGPTRTYGWLDKVTKLRTPGGESLRRANPAFDLSHFVHESSPAASSRPAIKLKFCTAWPAAPLTRLSTAESRITRFVRAS